jgi:hypothetical protein
MAAIHEQWSALVFIWAKMMGEDKWHGTRMYSAYSTGGVDLNKFSALFVVLTNRLVKEGICIFSLEFCYAVKL